MKVSALYLHLSALAFAPLILTGTADALAVTNSSLPNIEVVDVRKQNGVVCLPNNYALQDFDPMRPKSVPTYPIPQFDESGYIGPTDKFDSDVQDMLNSLTLEEKVGQMVQLQAGMLLGCDGLINTTFVEYLFDTWKIGSILDHTANQGGRWDTNSPQRFANTTNAVQQIAISKGSKIPMIWGLDSVRGANYIKGATIFATALNTAATFNRQLAYTAGRITAKDTRAAGVHWAFGPLADVTIQKLWSRNFENFGEDPYLTGEMVHYSIKGYQGNYKKDRTRVAACMKHFIGYSAPYNGKDREPRSIPMNQLMNYHVPSFQRAVDAGVATAMEAYGAVNGESVILSRSLLKTLLRDTMGFNGMMVTDWGEINTSFFQAKAALSQDDAIFLNLNNTSNDMSMVPSDFVYANTTINLVKAGKIPMSRIDESAGRIIQLKKDLGLFEQPFSDPALIDTVGSAQDVEEARQTARESLILHKNKNNVLPLKLEENVLFIGPNINSTRYMAGGWNMHWLGPSDLEGDAIYDGYGDTVLLGVQKLTNKTVQWVKGYDIEGKKIEDFNNIVRLARKADKVVFGFGENTKTEIPGDINTLTLNPDQYNLVERVAMETATPITLLLIQNRPFSLGKLSSYADAIINAGLPGTYGGLPIAELLYGKFSPSGRQPYTYPKMDYQSAVTYYTPIWNEYDPEFAFGTGFGYNNVTYSNVTVSSTELRPGKPITVSVTATNTGATTQLEPVIMYTTQKLRRLYSPERYRVRDFDKKSIAPGASAQFTFNLTAEEFKFWTVEMEHVLEEGPVDITINAGNWNAVKTSIDLFAA